MPAEQSPETKFDSLKKQLQDSILRDYPNPDRKGCPGGAVLQELAERPMDRAVEVDPHWHHITHCSACYREFLAFNLAFRSRVKVRNARIGWVIAVPVIVVVAAIFILVRQGSIFSMRPQNAELAYAKRTIVVPSTERSVGAEEQVPIFLDRLPLELTVELPIGSKAGVYELQLKRQKLPVLSTSGTAEIHNGTTSFTLKINLSDFEPGNYNMVVRQVPHDWNLYPVVIR
jgi:hypothetical protein